MKHTSEEIKYRLSDLGAQIGNIAIEYITELEKENEELKNRNQELLGSCEGATMMYKDLCKAKEIIKKYLSIGVGGKITQNYLDITKQVEQFLKENEE